MREDKEIGRWLALRVGLLFALRPRPLRLKRP